MAFQHGVQGSFQISDTGAVSRDISTFLTKIDGLPGVGEINETTTFQVAGNAKTFIRGLNTATISGAGFWDQTVTTGPDAVLSGLRTFGATPFIFGPQGTTVGNVKYTGSVLIQDYKTSVPVNNVISFTFTGTVTGQLTRGTF